MNKIDPWKPYEGDDRCYMVVGRTKDKRCENKAKFYWYIEHDDPDVEGISFVQICGDHKSLFDLPWTTTLPRPKERQTILN